ncbi:hypothetical protein ACFYVR_11455 [Rhodococcus sp. NPDC003318]|uniref:thiolase C-terminal domain-containing protein n=1 Tax=Rhodococcus sp. NPDC003318 TaxID=3364503 RepID=UPI0036787E47
MSGGRRVEVTGVARTPVRDAGVLEAAVAAVRAALRDAGVPGSEVDGVLASGPSAVDVADALGFELSWRVDESDREAVGAALVGAVDVVAAGRVRHLVCVEAFRAAPRTRRPGRFGPAAPVGGRASWHAPYGADDGVVVAALAARAYTERYGLTRAELAQIALVASANTGGGLRLRDYLTAPMVADPLCVYDRAAQAGGAAAVVLGAPEVTDDRGRSIEIAGVGAAYAVSPLWEQESARSDGPVERAGAGLLARSGHTDRDVDVVLLGDEYASAVLPWLEAFGFCGPGLAGGFVATGRRISRDGPVPVNPHGGHLGLGRRPDLDLMVEAVQQVRGEAGASQLPGPRRVAVVGLAGPTAAGCVLLRR